MKHEASLLYCVQVEGSLSLETPLLIGAGKEKDNTTDIHVLRDKKGQPFIPGTSLAGVLRHLADNWDKTATQLLFGYSDDRRGEGVQSAICIDDIPLENAYITVRDGVSIDEYTGVAKDKAKYDYEVVERGARGTFTMTWQLRQKVVDDLPKWKVFLDDLVKQLAYGIRIGAMTAKGFGYVRLEKAKIHLYDFSQYDDVKAWLSRKAPKTVYDVKAEERLGNQSFVIEADFALKTSLLVRSRDVSAADSEQNIDVVPMMSGNDYLIPGPSVKGVLRHQAAHILRVLGKSPDLLDGLMGYSRDDGKKQKSRFLVDEVYISPGHVAAVKQTRNAIDRFTGSTMDSKLFAEKPLWQKDKTRSVVTIRVAIEDCQDWEAGLALFLLKDLWTGQVALGGDKSVGRGYLTGHHADIRFQKDGVRQHWVLEENGNVTSGDSAVLETYAAALKNAAGRE